MQVKCCKSLDENWDMYIDQQQELVFSMDIFPIFQLEDFSVAQQASNLI